MQSRLITARIGRGVRPGRAGIRSELDYTLAREVTALSLKELPRHDLSLQVNGSEGSHQFRFYAHKGGRRFSASPNLDAHALELLVGMSRRALRRVAWGNEEPWQEKWSPSKYRYQNAASDSRFKADVIALAAVGYRMYTGIIHELSEGQTAALEDQMQAPGVVQVATTRPSHYVPAALFYDHPVDESRWTHEQLKLCGEFLRALKEKIPLATTKCFAGQCPSKEDDQVVCPSGFWGYRHEIGWPLSTPNGRFAMKFKGQPELTVGVSTDLDPKRTHAKEIERLGSGQIVTSEADLAKELEARAGLHLLYLYCHGGLINNTIPFVEIGKRKSPSISMAWLHRKKILWKAPRPLVFLNGCHTAALEPAHAINLVSGFVETAKAMGVMGTEVTVFEGLAKSFAEEMLPRFMSGEETVGCATRNAKLALLEAKNPLGLVYIPFVPAGAKLVPA